MIYAHLMLAFFVSLKIFAVNTDDKVEESVACRVRFEDMTEEEKRASLRLDFNEIAELQREIEAEDSSSLPNSPSLGSSSKKLKKSALSDPQITERSPKLSPTQRFLRRAFSPRSSSDQNISMLNKNRGPCIEIPQKPCQKSPNNQKSSTKWWKKLASGTRKRATEEVVTHTIISTTHDNPRYGAYINHFLMQLEKNLLKLFFELPLENHLQAVVQLPIKIRESHIRASQTFEEEYNILRPLWKPRLNRFFSKFQLGKQSENLIAWKSLVTQHFGVQRHAIDLSSLKKSVVDEVNPEDFSTLEIAKKVALWEKNSKPNIPKPQDDLKKIELTHDEISYIKFLRSLAEIICDSPPEYKYFFYALSQALKTPFSNAVPDSIMMNRLVLTNFFLFVIGPLILEMRIPPLALDKETINQLENSLIEENSWQIKNMRLKQEKALLKAMTLKMTEKSIMTANIELLPNEFEATLIQILNKTFEPVIQPYEPDSFVDQVERIKQQIIETLVDPSMALENHDPFSQNLKRE